MIVRRTRYELRKAEERAHILDGYVIALDNIDEVIKIIRGSETDLEAKGRLMERFGLSEAQTDAQVAEALSVAAKTVFNVRRRWVEAGAGEWRS